MKMIQVYRIDDNGFYTEPVIIYDPKDIGDMIQEKPPNGMYRAKWTGFEWIEGATQEEIEEMTKVEPSPPTETEILQQRLADVELMLVEMMTL